MEDFTKILEPTYVDSEVLEDILASSLAIYSGITDDINKAAKVHVQMDRFVGFMYVHEFDDVNEAYYFDRNLKSNTKDNPRYDQEKRPCRVITIGRFYYIVVGMKWMDELSFPPSKEELKEISFWCDVSVGVENEGWNENDQFRQYVTSIKKQNVPLRSPIRKGSRPSDTPYMDKFQITDFEGMQRIYKASTTIYLGKTEDCFRRSFEHIYRDKFLGVMYYFECKNGQDAAHKENILRGLKPLPRYNIGEPTKPTDVQKFLYLIVGLKWIAEETEGMPLPHQLSKLQKLTERAICL